MPLLHVFSANCTLIQNVSPSTLRACGDAAYGGICSCRKYISNGCYVLGKGGTVVLGVPCEQDSHGIFMQYDKGISPTQVQELGKASWRRLRDSEVEIKNVWELASVPLETRTLFHIY